MVIETNRISVASNGAESAKKISVPVPYARDGRISNDALDITMDCAVQKGTGNSSIYTEAEARQQNMESVELSADEGISPADFISRCMTGEDAKDLSGDETPLEEYTSSQLERAVSRVKEQRSEKQRAVEAQVSREREKEEAIEEAAIRNAAGASLSEKAQEQLQQSNLPVTPENVARLSHAAGMAAIGADGDSAAPETFSQAAMKFFIGNELSVTPENISGSIYGGRSGETAFGGEKPAEAFEGLEDQIAGILIQGGMTVTEKNTETAKWLYENNLPVTVENIRTCQSIEELKELDTDTLLARIADGMADGSVPEKADLTKLSVREAEAVVRRFETEADYISARRRLEETRLSMTVEAVRTMSEKGIKLDVSDLETIVKELREQEEQARQSLLQETGLEDAPDAGRTVSDTVQAARQVLAAPVELLAISSPLSEGGEELSTLGALSQSAEGLRARYEKAGQAYETVGTEVRRDLGDSMTKAFRNIDDILEDIGMERTAMNQRAVRILAYNQIPLTRENICEMKAHDARITSLMEHLKPPVVAELVKEGVNPLEISLDELNQKVAEISQKVAPEDISFRRFLWKLDHQGGLTNEERESMIGIYRLLDKIEKSDGAVIGQVVREGKELSLASLLSATRTRRAEGLDVQIDDAFGALEQVQAAGPSISEQIQAAYGASVASGLRRELSPKALRNLAGEAQEMSLEALLEACRDGGETETEMSEYYQQTAEMLRDAMEDSEGQIQRFLQALDRPDSAAERVLAQAYLANGGREFVSVWKKEESERIQEAFDEPEELDALYDEIDESHKASLEKNRERDDITYDGILSLARMANSISFYKNLRSREVYEVPIVTERGVTACNVTIQSGGGQKGTVEISMDSEELGRIQAAFRVNGTHVRGFVTADRAESLPACREILNEFEKDLEKNGFTMDSESLVQGNRNSSHTGNKSEGAKNRDLYRIAKCFIQNVSRKDGEYED